MESVNEVLMRVYSRKLPVVEMKTVYRLDSWRSASNELRDTFPPKFHAKGRLF